jgi:preprotein translocase subunit SecE
MNLGKLFQKKSTESGNKPAKSQRADVQKKPGQKQVKSKKPEQAVKRVAKKPDEPRFQWWKRFREYLHEVAYELRKVIWPSRKESIGSTSVVLVIVILCGVYLGIIDAILSRLVRLLVG